MLSKCWVKKKVEYSFRFLKLLNLSSHCLFWSTVLTDVFPDHAIYNCNFMFQPLSLPYFVLQQLLLSEIISCNSYLLSILLESNLHNVRDLICMFTAGPPVFRTLSSTKQCLSKYLLENVQQL